MLKFENVAKVGDIIKSMDFNPALGVNSFILAKVLNKNSITGSYEVEVIKSVSDSEEFNAKRKGIEMIVPFELGITEFEDRVTLVVTKEDLEMFLAYEKEEVFH